MVGCATLAFVGLVIYKAGNSEAGNSGGTSSAVDSPMTKPHKYQRQAPLQTPYGPQDIVLNPSGTEAYVSSELPGYGLITELNLKTDTVERTIHIPGGAYDFAVARDGRRAYVINSPPGVEMGTVVPVDLMTGAIGHGMPAGPSPEYVAVSPTAPVALVQGTKDYSDIRTGSDGGPDVLTLLNLVSGATRTLSGLGSKPLLGALGVSRNDAYLTDYEGETPQLISVNLTTGRARTDKAELGNAMTVMAGATLCTSILNASETSLTLRTINSATGISSSNTVTQPFGQGPRGLILRAISPEGRQAYVSGFDEASDGSTQEPTVTRFTFSTQELGVVIHLADVDNVAEAASNPDYVDSASTRWRSPQAVRWATPLCRQTTHTRTDSSSPSTFTRANPVRQSAWTR